MLKRITIQIVGTTTDREDVRIDDFISQLQDVKKALRENELAITRRDEASLDYKVVGLRHDSPATVVLEPIPVQPSNGTFSADLVSEVISSFATELRSIKKTGSLLREPELARLRAYQKLGTRENNSVTKIKIAVGKSAVTIDKVFQKKLDNIVGPDEFAEGSVSGMLEAVNFHNTNRFHLYPTIGPKHITGTFREGLRPRVKDAIGNFVTVSGKLRYKTWAQFPHGVIAEDVDIHEPDFKLPRLSELRGAFMGTLGELDSVQFVEALRED